MTGFDRLDVTEQDSALLQMETSRFFSLLHRHTIEGMFSDPIHGGNVDMIGWQMIGFPGPRMSYRAEIEKYRGEAYRPKPASLNQLTGGRIRPSEDEGLK
jgi:gluconate 2-dehydrogenase gamma chain